MIKKTLMDIQKDIISNKDKLTELDRIIGDADHGNNMSLGFNEFISKIDSINDNTQEVIKALGMTLMSKVGGASGPLYGMSFVKGSIAFSKENNTYNCEEFKNFVSLFTTSVQTLGKAEVSNKTMLDVWKPLSEKLESSECDKKELIAFVEELAEKTIPLKALKGRASYLGERSIGHKDPGAASSAIILKHLIEGISND